MKVISTVILILGLCVVVSCVQTIDEIEEPVIKYEGPQTPEAILEAFSGISTTFNKNVSPGFDEEYSPTKWLQMLIDKDVVIEDSYDFNEYMSLRRYLIREKREYLINPEKWLTKMFKMYSKTTFNDWETFEAVYIDGHIWRYQQTKAAKQKDPKVHIVRFLGPDNRTVVPLPKKSIVISRYPGGYGYKKHNPKISNQQIFDIVFKGKHPWGWKVVYVDDMNNILPEKPAPISREELGLPAGVPWPPKNQVHLDRIIEEIKQGRYNDEDN